MDLRQTSTEECAELLEETGWARGIPWDLIKQIAEFLDTFEVQKGSVVLQEGSRDAYMGILVSGKLRVEKRDSNDEFQDVAFITPGQSFGEMSMVDNQPRSASVYAAEDSTILLMPQQKFFLLGESHPRAMVMLLLKISKLLSARLRQASGKLVEYLS